MEVESRLEERLYDALIRYTSEPTARGILRRAQQQRTDTDDDSTAFFDTVIFGAKLFVEEPRREQLLAELSKLCHADGPAPTGEHYELTIADEHSARRARMLIRRLVQQAGGRDLLAVRAATALSELTRNALSYAGGGKVLIDMLTETNAVRVVVSDHGPGITNVDEIFAGLYRSKTGLGRGLAGVKKLASRFKLNTSPRGTTVEFEIGL